MTPRIIVNKHQTSIYIPKENGYVLEKTIKDIQKLKHYSVIWSSNHFIIKYPLNPYHKQKIINAFKVEKQRKVDKTVISGFKGCLITGYKFEWL